MAHSTLVSYRDVVVDILYVHPAKQETDARYDRFVASPPYAFIPVGVIGLLNMLREQGWMVRGLNLPVELLLQPAFDLRHWLGSQGTPRLVMVDLHWYEHCFGAIDVARAAKSVWPQTPVVLGGITASCYADEIIETQPVIDYVICGDAEEPVRMLAAHHCGGHASLADVPNLVYRSSGQVQRSTRRYCAASASLDQLDHVTTDWLEHWESYAGLQYSGAGLAILRNPTLRGHWLAVGRGCRFDCIYCGGSRRAHAELAGRQGYVQRSPERVAADIYSLQDRGIHQVGLSLDISTFKSTWWRTFFRILEEKGIRVGLYNEFFQLPSSEFIERLAQTVNLTHTEVALSPLSGAEVVRRLNGKSYTNERLLRTLKVLRRHRVPVFVYFSLNLPGETPQTFQRTVDLAGRISRLYPPDLLRMIDTCHTLDPASPMSVEPQRYGVEIHYRSFQDYYDYCRGTGWQARRVTRGEHRGFEMRGRPPAALEAMAQEWDDFAAQQACRCYPVPRGY